MGNEMGNSNVSGLKEEAITAENSSPEANHADHVEGENQIVSEGEHKDFHEKIDNQTSDGKEEEITAEHVDHVEGENHIVSEGEGKDFHEKIENHMLDGKEQLQVGSNDASGEESRNQAISSPEDMEHSLEKETELSLGEIPSGKGDHQIKKHTSIRSEPLESVAAEADNRDEHELGAVYEEPHEEGNKGSPESPSCQAEETESLLETKPAQNLAASVFSDATDLTKEKIKDENLLKEIASQENLEDSSISHDQCESTSEEVPNVMNLTRNGSSNSDQEAILKVNSSNSSEQVLENVGAFQKVFFQQVPTEMSLRRNGSSAQVAISKVNSSNSFKKVPSAMNLTTNGSSKSAQEAVSRVNSSNSFEQVPPDLDLTRNDSSKSEEETISLINSSYPFGEDTTEMNLSRNSPSKSAQEAISLVNSSNLLEVPIEMNFTSNGSSKSPKEAINRVNSSNSLEEVPQPQDKCMVLPENANVVTNLRENETKHQPNPIHEQPVNELKNDEVSAAQNKSMPFDSSSVRGNEICPFETVPTELTATEDNHEEEEATEQTEKKEDINSIEEKAENLKALGIGTEEREAPEKPTPRPHCANDINKFLTDLNQENIELRKSPSFDFDLLLEARSEESYKTPLLHPKKTKTRSMSMLDGSVQYEGILVEEKTIKVERSDSDKQRAPFLDFLKEEDKKEDDCVDEKREVAITKRREKRKPRPSLFSTCICCAAAIN